MVLRYSHVHVHADTHLTTLSVFVPFIVVGDVMEGVVGGVSVMGGARYLALILSACLVLPEAFSALTSTPQLASSDTFNHNCVYIYTCTLYIKCTIYNVHTMYMNCNILYHTCIYMCILAVCIYMHMYRYMYIAKLHHNTYSVYTWLQYTYKCTLYTH